MARPLKTQDDAAADTRERRCIVTGERESPNGLMRFALSPDGVVAPDFSGKLPGRGAWVRARRSAVEAAVKRRLFARAFKTPVQAPDNLAAMVEAGLVKAALSALGLARRAGAAVVGFEKTRAQLKTGCAGVLIAASDGAEDGNRKLVSLAGDAREIALFTRDELSAALGVDAVHAAIEKGPAATRFLKAAARLEDYRADELKKGAKNTGF